VQCRATEGRTVNGKWGHFALAPVAEGADGFSGICVARLSWGMEGDRRRQPFDRRRPVLIMSANPDFVDLYVLSLRSERNAVLSVTSVEEAVYMVRERAVSAVVVDVSNPATDWDACQSLATAAEPGLPIIVLTGWIDPDARQRAVAIGCAAFVVKPASAHRLRDILQRTRSGERGIVSVE
jgi:CheY-like chemotaxis protein